LAEKGGGGGKGGGSGAKRRVKIMYFSGKGEQKNEII